MSESSIRSRMAHLLGLMVCLVVGLSLVQSSVQAVEQPDDAIIQADCTTEWSAPISDQGYYFPDLNAVYWSYRFDTINADATNVAFRIHGLFAYARNASFNLYTVLNDGSVEGSHLTDLGIVPDAGSVNPYLPGVNRHASNRSYTVWLVPEDSLRVGDPNTLTISAESTTAMLILRVYRADAGFQNGGVPLPTIEAFDDDSGQGVACPLVQNAWPSSPIDQAAWPVDAPQVSFYRLGGIGYLPNGDNLYLGTDLAPAKYGQILVLRFYAPTFLDTYQHPETVFTGNEEVRYMSLCMGNQLNTRTSRCVADDQFTHFSSGYYNVVVGPNRADVRAAALARGYNFMTWDSATPILIYRQMLPRAGFVGSIEWAPVYDAGQPEASQRAENFMGIYAPIGRYCSINSFLAGGTCGMPAS